ncbi:hypothetical protein TWF173_011095 [Orbilia oligospora]|uniref:Uncharacterized protein n=1 Tax=Arthrobotrys oligospora (strain ATCC 24927 / CBS 115.81 / DSM 1491) TaxID=756982 RepID=G1X7Q5_ARTOA|nr:hypothetical protein AOL_s00054g972 [Orbilia oligospora ATCC 24927]EGX50886.1 hypothetical protein AOL_s00054g972 [Orbilia oligospora ATCC 24927]KAF3317440.1 hypothetical protein TWF173_011095 [Orbilia oligospora]
MKAFLFVLAALPAILAAAVPAPADAIEGSALLVHPGPSGSRAGMNARGLAAPPMLATHAAKQLAALAKNRFTIFGSKWEGYLV